MRIQSKFSDFYDCGAAYGVDKHIFYDRKYDEKYTDKLELQKLKFPNLDDSYFLWLKEMKMTIESRIF